MIFKYLVIALILYVGWRMLRRDLRRRFGPARARPQPAAAIETVKCARCGLYLPQGLERNCGLAACPWPVPATQD